MPLYTRKAQDSIRAVGKTAFEMARATCGACSTNGSEAIVQLWQYVQTVYLRELLKNHQSGQSANDFDVFGREQAGITTGHHEAVAVGVEDLVYM